MRLLAKVFIGAVLLLGAGAIARADWRLTNLAGFAGVFCAAILASGMKVKLPGILGTLSVNYFFILIAIAGMSQGEALAVGCGSALMQCLWNARRRVRLVQTVFSVMNIAISVSIAYVFYHSAALQSLSSGSLLALMAASLLYFGTNTAGVAMVVALTERKPVAATWRTCYFWSFPFYLMAASLVWIVLNVDVKTQWLNALALSPVIFVVYYSYRMYLEKVEAGRKEVELANALQKRTIEALEAAREANTLKSRFVASISHELRTPLTGIVGFAEMLHDGILGPLNDVQKDCVADMLNCSTHLRMLIGQVLDLARIEAGKMPFTYETVSVPRLVHEVIDTLQAVAGARQIVIAVDTHDSLDSVRADAGRLKQILYNYLSNALKFTAPGGLVRVTARATDEAAYRIDVIDNGAGIPPEEIPRLFSEFGQLGNSEKSKTGSGLGLAICRSIAEAQGGQVGVTSEAGRGSAFFVSLPRAPKEPPGAEDLLAGANPDASASQEPSGVAAA